MSFSISSELASLPKCFVKKGNEYKLTPKKLDKKFCHLFYTSKQEREVELVEHLRKTYFSSPETQKSFQVKVFELGTEETLNYCTFPKASAKTCLKEAKQFGLKRFINFRVITGSQLQNKELNSNTLGTTYYKTSSLQLAQVSCTWKLIFPEAYDKSVFYLFEPEGREKSSYQAENLEKQNRLLQKALEKAQDSHNRKKKI